MILEKYSFAEKLHLEDVRPEYQAEDGSFRLPDGREAPVGKPVGFWFSVPGEDDWPSWCRKEDFRIDALRWRHTYQLDVEDVLVLDSYQKMLEFNATWGTEYRIDKLPTYRQAGIKWKSLAESGLKGVVIPHYFWSCRLDPHFWWYYGWDCSSGVFWDMSCLTWIKSEETELWIPDPLEHPRDD